jgi:hypothetical protein
VTRRDELNSIPERRNCALEVTQLPEAPETSSQGGAEAVKTSRFVGVPLRGEVNGKPVPRNCVLEVTRLSEALKTNL